MIEAIRTHLPGAVVHGAAEGLHLLITFEAGWSDAEVAEGVAILGDIVRRPR